MISWIKERLFGRRFNSTFPNVQICMPAYIEYLENLDWIGHGYIGPHSYWSAKGGLRIGNNVIFGPRTVIWTYNHNYRAETALPYDGPDILKPVTIGDNVWVGMGAMILPGVTIGEGAVIGAGAVVGKDVPPCAIVAGNPAQVVRHRDQEIYEKLKVERKFYLEMKRKGSQ